METEAFEGLGFIRTLYRVKGKDNVLLVWRILQTMKRYTVLTVRQLYYLLISRFGYPGTRTFYKRMDRYLTKIRRLNPEVHAKFVDPTRRFLVPPLPYPSVEVWVEKDSIRSFIAPLASKYRLGIQVLRGFGSLSTYRKALERARRRGVRTVLYLGDFDPSGLLIEEVAQSEMDHRTGIRFVRLALTWDQIKRLSPPSRPVNLKDSRWKAYVEKYGERVWEIEALRPRTLYRIVEEGLRAAVPPEYLKEAEARERAARLAKPLMERLRRAIEQEAFRMLEAGVPGEETLRRLSEKYGLGFRGEPGKGLGTLGP